MDHTALAALFEQLEIVVRTAADEEIRGGPTWLGDLSVANVDVVRELRTAAESGRLVPGPGFNLVVLLGESWVELHDEVDDLIAEINRELSGSRHDT